MAAPAPTGISTNHLGEGTNGIMNGNGETNGLANGHSPVLETPKQMPIAIVGMACRLPGNVATPDEFWELCSRARNGWSEIPKERFENAAFHHPNPGKSGTHNPVGGCFLKGDLGLFDAPFFSLTAQEATSLDPQQRLLLECTFEALDSAGIPKHSVVGKDVGVFIGGSFSEYESHLFRDPDTIPMYQATGNLFLRPFPSLHSDSARVCICYAVQPNFTFLRFTRALFYNGYCMFIQFGGVTFGLPKFAERGVNLCYCGRMPFEHTA